MDSPCAALRHQNLVRMIVKTYFLNMMHFGYDFDDLVQEGLYAVMRAESRYDPAKGQETTFYARAVRNWLSWRMGTRKINGIDRAYRKPFASADGILRLYKDWRDMASWPQVPGQKAQHAPAAKQEDPTTKPGVVGAWCRTYNIYQVMEQFLQGAYEPVDTGDDRYTFTGGSTAGGAIVYDKRPAVPAGPRASGGDPPPAG